MSEIACSNCGELVTLSRTPARTLRASCGCTDRATRVTEALPDGWSQ